MDICQVNLLLSIDNRAVLYLFDHDLQLDFVQCVERDHRESAYMPHRSQCPFPDYLQEKERV